MFDIGGPEFLLLVVLGLLVFGPRRLPQIGKQVGGYLAQMKSSVRDFQGSLEREIALEDLKQAAGQVRDLRRDAAKAVQEYLTPPPAEPPPPASPADESSESGTDSGAPPAPDPPAGPAG